MKTKTSSKATPSTKPAKPARLAKITRAPISATVPSRRPSKKLSKAVTKAKHAKPAKAATVAELEFRIATLRGSVAAEEHQRKSAQVAVNRLEREIRDLKNAQSLIADLIRDLSKAAFGERDEVSDIDDILAAVQTAIEQQAEINAKADDEPDEAVGVGAPTKPDEIDAMSGPWHDNDTTLEAENEDVGTAP